MSEQNDVAMATSIEIGSCDCPSIHILLKDSDGNVFAAAAMPPATAWSVAKDILSLISAIQSKSTDTIGQCEGHA